MWRYPEIVKKDVGILLSSDPAIVILLSNHLVYRELSWGFKMRTRSIKNWEKKP
jgi:hypothetical protein